MHELSLMEGVRDLILEAQATHGFSRVLRVTLEVGACSTVEPEALSFCFEVVMAGGPAADAVLDMVLVEAAAWCGTCEQEVTVNTRSATCPGCGGVLGVLRRGTDLKIKDLEVE